MTNRWQQQQVRLPELTWTLYDSAPDQADWPICVWAHGWAHRGQLLLPVVEALGPAAGQGVRHLVLDFPGFGASSLPPVPWGVADYARATAAMLEEYLGAQRPVAWVGHSFGCRVGVHLAAGLWPISKLLLVAAPGLPYARPWPKQLQRWAKRTLARTLRHVPMPGSWAAAWRQRLGSADYRAAGALRPTLVKVLQDDLSGLVPQLQPPVWLVYGEADTETPPAIGEKFVALQPQAQLTRLADYDHVSILQAGRFQLARLWRNWWALEKK